MHNSDKSTHESAYDELFDALKSFSPSHIKVEGQLEEAEPVMAIPECMDVLDLIQVVITDICAQHGLATPNPNFGGESMVNMEDMIAPWLNVMRDELCRIYGKGMLTADIDMLDNGIDLYGEAE